MVGRLLATAALWVESRHLSQIQNGRNKQRSGQHTLARKKIYKKLKLLRQLSKFFLTNVLRDVQQCMKVQVEYSVNICS